MTRLNCPRFACPNLFTSVWGLKQLGSGTLWLVGATRGLGTPRQKRQHMWPTPHVGFAHWHGRHRLMSTWSHRSPNLNAAQGLVCADVVVTAVFN
jgi:hypothetical protein